MPSPAPGVRLELAASALAAPPASTETAQYSWAVTATPMPITVARSATGTTANASVRKSTRDRHRAGMSRWRPATQAIDEKWRRNMKRKPTNTLRRLALCAAPLILICSVAVAPVRAQDAVTAEQTQTPTDQQLSEGQIEQ